jgi:PAS domain S-box-containing protein
MRVVGAEIDHPPDESNPEGLPLAGDGGPRADSAATTIATPDALPETLLALLERVTDGVYALDRDWRYTYVNAAAAGLVGRRPEELVGRNVWALFPDAVGLPFFEAAQRAEATGEPSHVEAHYPPLDAWFESTIYPSAEGYTIVSRDVTARRRADAALREREELLSLTLHSARAGLWAVDLDTDRDEWSDEVFPLLGLDPSQVEASFANLLAVMHPADRAWLEPKVDADIATGREGQSEFRVVWPDGSVHWIFARGRTIVDGRGRPRRVGLFLDITDRKRAEEEVARLAEQLRVITDAMPALIAYVDADRRYRFNNKTYEAWFGHSREELAGKHLREVLGDAAYDMVRPLVDAALSGQPVHFEDEIPYRDGGTRSVRADYVPDIRPDGSVAGYFALITDITDRKAAENAARESEARARFLAEASAVLAGTLDYDEAVERVVRLAVPSVADWCVVDLLGEDGALHRLAIVHGDPERAAVAEELRRRFPTIPPTAAHTAWKVLRSGQPWFDARVSPDRFVAEARDETHLDLLRQLGFVSELVVPLMARGRALGVLTLVAGDSGLRYGADDVAMAEELARQCALAIDNARLYREARNAEARVRRLFDAGVIGLTVVDAERIIEANDHFLRMTGYDREDLEAGRLRWREMTPPEYAALDARGDAELTERGFCTPFEKEYLRRDGSRVPILIGAAEVQPDPPLWICGIVDLTAQKAAEQDRLALVDAATHDLKNPLTSLKTNAQLLLRRLRRGQAIDADGFASGLEAIDEAAGRMLVLIDELLDAAHLRAGRALELRLDPVDLVALAETAIAEAQGRTSRHEIRLEAAVAELAGVWDGARLERVLANLLGNAVKYSPDGGEIVVRIWNEDGAGAGWACLSVSDRGIGIPVADLPRLFERFHRGANVTGRIVGSGIGLAGARQIVAQHGGTIGVTSTEGQGSTFTVRLPLAASAVGDRPSLGVEPSP